MRPRYHIPCGLPLHRNGETCPVERMGSSWWWLSLNHETREALGRVGVRPPPTAEPAYLRSADDDSCEHGCGAGPGEHHAASCPEPGNHDAAAVGRVIRDGALACVPALLSAAVTGAIADAPVSAIVLGYMISGVASVIGVGWWHLCARPAPRRARVQGGTARACGCETSRLRDGSTAEYRCARHCPSGTARTRTLPPHTTSPPPPPPPERPAATSTRSVDRFPAMPLDPCPGCGHLPMVSSPYTSAAHPPWHEHVDDYTARCSVGRVDRSPDPTYDASTVCPHDAGPMRLRADLADEFDG